MSRVVPIQTPVKVVDFTISVINPNGTVASAPPAPRG